MAPASAKAPVWTTEGPEKRKAVRQMFGEIAGRYDLLNSLMTLRLHYRWRSLAVDKLNLKPGDQALDVCCGTGDFALPLRTAVGRSGTVVGLDFCRPMVEIARRKQKDAARFLLGDAQNLPVPSNRFDAVTVGWGIRNVSDIDRSHCEIFRVLKAGGRFVSLDTALPQSALVRGLSKLFCSTVTPILGLLFANRAAYTYLPKSTERFWDREKLKASMERAGFRQVGFADFLMGNICMHWGEKP
ncbi:MAG TPA: bifunctional demethylmenaquinone methyltransferase/2-methoxy-6-polyprenyl-1,4-benzoquinol methylase UbiE [Fimbriimonas sp.]|nr:bifunctional demethylmenaquinone methyltransferase/2-methoxy-6-polyprenyl-1,4-benzoquinol methylase UbiE [Fimbriimonas sp.]